MFYVCCWQHSPGEHWRWWSTRSRSRWGCLWAGWCRAAPRTAAPAPPPAHPPASPGTTQTALIQMFHQSSVSLWLELKFHPVAFLLLSTLAHENINNIDILFYIGQTFCFNCSEFMVLLQIVCIIHLWRREGSSLKDTLYALDVENGDGSYGVDF